LGVLLFIGLVIVHELGHFIVARRNGVVVEEFGVGFPPRAWARKTKKGFLFTINWLPIGGFVRLKGENDADKRPGSLGAASLTAKAKIMLAGVAMNLLIAFGLLTILGWLGMPQIVSNQFAIKSDKKVTQSTVVATRIEAGSPAEKAGLRPQDRIISIAGIEVKQASQLPAITKASAGSRATVDYERKGRSFTKDILIRSQRDIDVAKKAGKTQGYLGVTPSEYTLTRSTWSAPINAAGMIWQFTALTLKGLGTSVAALFQGDTTKASEQVSGPVGVILVLKDGSLLGYQFVLCIIALISLTLAIMNVLPIPALDGGRLFVIILARLFKKQLTEKMEERIVGTSFVFLLFLIGLVTVVDVNRFF
jgi:regulator of sigma E protease